MIDYKNQRVGVFIDVQNMYYTARNLYNRKVNFGNIVKKAVGERQLIRAIAYVVSTKTGENQPFFDALANIGIETKEKELMEYYGGQKKADWDVGITVDAIRMSESLDVIVLVSGDGDYIPLVDYLKSRGKIVEVVSFRETTSTRLVEAIGAEYYTNLSENKRGFLIGARGASSKSLKQTESSKTASKSKDISNIIDGQEKVESKPKARATRKPAVKPAAKSSVRKPAARNAKPKTRRAGSRSKEKIASSRAPRNDAPKKATTAARKKPLRKNVRTARKGNDEGMSDNEKALNN
ncbi:MAG TPA: NYN domain-containing protein [Patescibacteria group bacterium]|nr:NYN domain-containing protein [Patescibacteria group bacterium]